MLGKTRREWRTFLSQARQNWHHTGAVAPSSRSLARAVTRPMARRARGEPVRIAEVGPGTGAFTREIARQMDAQDVLDVFDINPAFLDFVRERVATEAVFLPVRDRIHLHHLDARSLPAGGRYRFLVSGLPFNNFPPEVVQAILDAYLASVVPGGDISFFEYAMARQARRLLPGKNDASRGVDQILRRTLGTYGQSRDLVVANVPPAIVHHLRRPMEPGAPPGV